MFSTGWWRWVAPGALTLAALAVDLTLIGRAGNRLAGTGVGVAAAIILAALDVLAIPLVAAHLITVTLVYRRHERQLLKWLGCSVPATAIAAIIVVVTAGNTTSHAWIPKVQIADPYNALLDFTGARLALSLVLGLVVVGGVIGVATRSQYASVLAIGLPWLLLPATALLAASVFRPVFVSRYLLFSLPALALLAATGFMQIYRLSIRFGRTLPIGLAVVCLGALIASVAKPQAALRRLDAHGDDPAAETADLLAMTRPGDGIVYTPRDLVHSLVLYAGVGRLPADALLARSAAESSTLNGVQVRAFDAPRAL